MAYTAFIGATAAKHHREMVEREEETMVHYTAGDLNEDWEFKIVRSETPVFRKREVLDRLIEEESYAGWVMLEKLDDRRIRFKRPRSARTKDTYLPPDVDPYRSHYGPSVSRPAVLLALVMVGAMVFLVLGVLAFGLALR
jgi:hypothetical protein